MSIQPISTAFGDPQRHDFSLPDRGRCPRNAPKSAESAGTGLAPRRGPGDELESLKDLLALHAARVDFSSCPGAAGKENGVPRMFLMAALPPSTTTRVLKRPRGLSAHRVIIR